jgi:uncharacterized membrane protein
MLNVGPPHRKIENDEQLARGLGWFSIGLGATEVLMPNVLARSIGVRKKHGVLIRLLGLREITSGIGIFSRRKRPGWLWSRVIGDVVDLSLLGGAFASRRNKRNKLALAATGVLGVTALDFYEAKKVSSITRDVTKGDTIFVTRSVIINRPADELYRFWHDMQNLPRFMQNLETVHMIGANRSHWEARGRAGRKMEWDAEIVSDTPNEMITWRSVDDTQIPNAGSVQFVSVPEHRGTKVVVELQYKPPAWFLGTAAARLFGRNPGQQLQEDLRRLKQLVETGEIPTTKGQPSGRRSATGKFLKKVYKVH